MPIIATAGGNFTPAPAGTHAAVCCDVIALGEVEVTFQGKTQRKDTVLICWQIDEKLPDGRPYLLRRRYTKTLHEKSSLRKDLESWRGRPFTNEELQGFDLENLLSIGCLVSVIHQTRDGSTYSNVTSVCRLPRNMTAPTVRDYVRVCDRPPAQTDAVDDGLGTDDDVPF
jgi:hypothetical protein